MCDGSLIRIPGHCISFYIIERGGGQTAERNYKNMTKKTTKAMREDFKKCEELANKIMEEFDIEIPFLTWAFMTYEELLELEEELKNK